MRHTAGGEDRVAAAFRAVPRSLFLPRAARRRAAYDGPIDIGHGQTNSQPRTVENMLRLLDVHPGQRVLDVGAGSGWTTGLLAHLVSPEGRVHGVELVPELVEVGAGNLVEAGITTVTIEEAAPGVLGLPDHAPYDRILVSADAATLPVELVTQLADGGVMVVPVGGVMTRVVRDGDRLETSRHGVYRFVPLR